MQLVIGHGTASQRTCQGLPRCLAGCSPVAQPGAGWHASEVMQSWLSSQQSPAACRGIHVAPHGKQDFRTGFSNLHGANVLAERQPHRSPRSSGTGPWHRSCKPEASLVEQMCHREVCPIVVWSLSREARMVKGVRTPSRLPQGI